MSEDMVRQKGHRTHGWRHHAWTAARTPATETTAASVWHHGDFRTLWGGETLSQVGSQITTLALPLTAVITLHASPIQAGLLTAAQFAPNLLLSLPAGVWFDRNRRRPALLAANLGRFVVLALVPLLYVLDGLTMSWLYGTAFLVGALTAIFDVAYLVYLPSLVPRDQLVSANAQLEASFSVAQVSGPGIGGWLVQLLSAPGAVIADAATYLVSALSIGLIRRPEPEPEAEPDAVSTRMIEGIRSGLRATLGHELLRPLTIQSAWSNLCEMATLTLLPIFAVRTLHLSPGVLGLLLSIGGLGGVLGSMSSSRLQVRLGTGRTLLVSMTLTAVGLLLLPTARGAAAAPVLAASLVVYGFGIAVYNVHSLSLRLALSPPNLISRVTATFRFVVYGTIPLGGLLGGAMGDLFGTRAALTVSGAALVVSVIPFAATRVTRARQVGAEHAAG
jgi:MFS family permease